MAAYLGESPIDAGQQNEKEGGCVAGSKMLGFDLRTAVRGPGWKFINFTRGFKVSKRNFSVFKSSAVSAFSSGVSQNQRKEGSPRQAVSCRLFGAGNAHVLKCFSQ